MKKRNLLSTILYVVAGLLMIYTIWAIVSCAGVISEAVKSGQLSIGGNLYNVISFYMSSCAQYFVYALLLAASGVILHRIQPASAAEIVPVPSNESDHELDDEVHDNANTDKESDR